MDPEEKKDITPRNGETTIIPEAPAGVKITTMLRIPSPEEDQPSRKKKKKHTSTYGHPQLFNDNELESEVIDLSADPSLRFRRLLNQNSDRYRIEKLIATGGFGQIFLAEDKILGRKAVIKSLKEEFLKDDAAVERFISEAKLCAQLKHPAIVPPYSLNTDGIDGLHLAMQLIRGITLREYIRRSLEYLKKENCSQHAFNHILRERLEIFLRICDAVHFCHERTIIHNDLKPDNIMLSGRDQVYVMDWGIASTEGSVCKGGIPGTLSYMSPERITTGISNRRTDIFALGMILNELVTLRGPIEEEESRKIMERICTGSFEPSTCILPRYQIAKSMRAIIEKARAQKPDARYSTAKHLADDVRHFLFYEEVQACPDTLFSGSTRFLIHHKVAAFTAVLLIILAAGFTVFLSHTRRQETIRIMTMRNLQDLTLLTETEKLAADLGQRFVLLQEQIRSLGNTFRMEAEKRDRPPDRSPYYTVRDFDPANPRRLRGLVHTAYCKYPITLDHGTFFCFNPSVRDAELRRWNSCFRALYSQMQSAMFMSTENNRNNIRNDRNKLFHLRESLIRRMIFSLHNGIVYTFPGRYDPAKKPSDFQSEYVLREFRAGHKLFWSPPVRDAGGWTVISCWQTLFDSNGKQFGGIGFNVSFHELMKPLLDRVEEAKDGSTYAVVDEENRIICSSERSFSPEGECFYRHPVVLRKIRRAGTIPNFPIMLDGKQYRIFWARIPAVGWLLIRHVPVEK